MSDAVSRGHQPGRLGITIGDPNGIGPEIAVKAALAVHATCQEKPLIIGEPYIIDACCNMLGLTQSARAAFEIFDPHALRPGDWHPGKISAAAGAATAAYVRAAIDLHNDGRIQAIGAAPHCEAAVNAAGIPFSGYGGLVADYCAQPRDRAFLMLEAKGLRVVHCTLHESTVAAVQRITQELVERAAGAARETLILMGIENPTLCVLGINPHAGEDGLFGSEDEVVTKPAVDSLRKRGWNVDGPVGADLALSERRYDAYVAMLHDQGHIATKMLSPKGATALVAGLPILFASVGHGAAFNIAGKGVADASAMIDTLNLLQRAMEK